MEEDLGISLSLQPGRRGSSPEQDEVELEHIVREDSDVEQMDSDVEQMDSDVEQIDGDVEQIDSVVEQNDSDVEQIESDVEQIDSDEGEMESLDAKIREAQARYREAENGLRETEARGRHSFPQAMLVAPCIMMSRRGHKVTFSCQVCGGDLTKGAREEHLAGHFREELAARNLLGNTCRLCSKDFQDHLDAVVHVAIVHKKLPLFVGGLGGRVQGREAKVGSACQGGELGESVQGGDVGETSQGDENGEPGQGEEKGEPGHGKEEGEPGHGEEERKPCQGEEEGEPGQREEAGDGSTHENYDFIYEAGQGDCLDEDREEGFHSQNGQEDNECQGKTEEEKDNAETKRNEPRICELRSQNGSQDLNQNKEVGGVHGENDASCDKDEMGKDAVRNQVKKVKTVKSARRSERHQVKLVKITEIRENRRHDGTRPKLVRDQGNLLSKDKDNVEAKKVPDEDAQSPGKDRIPLVKPQKYSRKAHQCKECKHNFAQKLGLQRHLATVHRGEKDHQCTQCENKFGIKSGLQRHVANVHHKLKPHQCEECGKKFSQKVTLNQHMSGVHKGLKPFQCPECVMKLGRKDDLKRHLSYMHGGQKSYLCTEPDCNGEFVIKVDLLNHLRLKHSHPKLECVIKGCSAKFTWSSEYYKHKKIAHNEKTERKAQIKQGVVNKRKYVKNMKIFKKGDVSKKREGVKEKEGVDKKQDIKLMNRTKIHTGKKHDKGIKISYNSKTEKSAEIE